MAHLQHDQFITLETLPETSRQTLCMTPSWVLAQASLGHWRITQELWSRLLLLHHPIQAVEPQSRIISSIGVCTDSSKAGATTAIPKVIHLICFSTDKQFLTDKWFCPSQCSMVWCSVVAEVRTNLLSIT
jgi:hypothetical protein